MSDPQSAGELLACGRIGKPHGIRGEVTVEAWTDDPAGRFVPGAVLRTDRPTAGPLTIATARDHSGRWVVGFEGIADRTAAEGLRGTILQIAAADRPTIDDPDEYYDTDLVGLAVRTVNGAAVGTVTEVIHGPAGDSLAVQAVDREHLIPFVTSMVPTVDLSAGLIEIDPPDGLLDL
ncbi:MAG: ribosome maturation factor RimM [Jatrophihabitans sp.]